MRKALLFVLILASNLAYTQDNLLDLIDENEKPQEVMSTFKGTRIILGHSVKMKAKKELEFLITHRFGRINSGSHNLWGLDNAFIRLGLEYGLSDKLNIGIGRSSFDKTYDSFLKYKLARQTKGSGSFPVSLVLFNSFTIKTTPKSEDSPEVAFNDRLANVSQLLISRKINSLVSVQLMPTYIYKSTVEEGFENSQLALGVGGRVKLTPRLAFNAEYYYRLDAPESIFTNSFSLGFDIETGGHVFQLHFTNSIMTVERAFITETSDDFFDGDIHFGFNISRTFNLGSKKEKSW
ncbi:hypothetical protein E1176_18605 [Fulvivirga sp. RKSG066]|uniref:DUF5777 family beta-barrel protein n=1 Tax=Fulvivirga aurantia TaxID=2529383 RepID=UPI0012BD5C93|nr:DUF5777 family beta-barrel protein [Fulvivirga aurantia]MTI23048.1 hypothetical protein [Fulvivirga aurantia]